MTQDATQKSTLCRYPLGEPAYGYKWPLQGQKWPPSPSRGKSLQNLYSSTSRRMCWVPAPRRALLVFCFFSVDCSICNSSPPRRAWKPCPLSGWESSFLEVSGFCFSIATAPVLCQAVDQENSYGILTGERGIMVIEDGSEGDAGVAAMVPTSKSESTNGTRILSRVFGRVSRCRGRCYCVLLDKEVRWMSGLLRNNKGQNMHRIYSASGDALRNHIHVLHGLLIVTCWMKSNSITE